MVRRAEAVMGTVVTVEVRDQRPGSEVEPAIAAVFATLRDLDERFSPYRADSEVSRLADGTLAESDVSPELRYVLAACDHLTESSDGAFDARHHRSDGRLDPSGFVKGWAVDEAALALEAAGLRHWSINAGGDVSLRGGPWTVGIQHPDLRDRVAARVSVSDGAIATSGLYERGSHIRDPRSGSVPEELRSVTVIGPELTWADAYATTAFAMGLDGLAWVERHPGYGAIAITTDDRLVWTPTVAPALLPNLMPVSS